MSLSEACEHGRGGLHYVTTPLGFDPCPGGRILSNAEALRTLLFDVCEKCEEGTVLVDTCVQCERPWGDGEPCGPESYAMPKPEPCPACDGSGRTLKDGVWASPHGYVIPASRLEGASDGD